MNIIDKYKNIIRKSKDGRTLLANFGYLSLLQIVGYFFPLITIPYLARIIGLESFGKIAFASAVIVWFQTVTDWGFNYTATREVAKNRNNIEKVSEIFSNVFWSRILLLLISFILLLIALFIIPKFRENSSIILITFLLIPGHIMFPEWFFQAMERMRYITILNLLSKSLFTIAIFIFIKQKNDYILQPLFNSLGFLVSGLIALFFIIIKWKVKLLKPNAGSIFKTIKESYYVFINDIMPNLYNSFSMLLLGFFGGSVSNGMLDSGSKFVSVFQQFMSVLSRAFFPFLSRRIDKHGFYCKVILLLSIILSIVLFITAPYLINIFFTKEFLDSIVVLRIMSISLFFLALNNIYGTNYLIIRGFERQLKNVTFFCSIIGFIISFPLIYYFDYIGAAITITFTRGLLGLLTFISARIIIKNE